MRKLLGLFLIILFGYGLYLVAQHLLATDLTFHTDIARDFLLMEDIIKTKDPTLIGPKAGGIPGMFFGPVWLYMLIPFMIVGSGNPLVIGYFWFALILFSILSVFFIAKKIFGRTSAIIAALLYTFCSVSFAGGFTQSFGSVILSPWLLYTMYLYWKQKQSRHLLVALLIDGFIYQCQPAVGMITLFVTIAFSLFLIIKRKRHKDLLSYFILLIPFSTYILFELKHDLLQIHAFINHFTGSGSPTGEKLTFTEYVSNRITSYIGVFDFVIRDSSQTNAFPVITFLKKYSFITHTLFVGMFAFIAYAVVTHKKLIGKMYYQLFFLYFIGFVIISNVYRGIIIDYYFWWFMPLTIIAFAGLYRIISKKFFFLLVGIILSLTVLNAIDFRIMWQKHFLGIDSSSWKLNRGVAKFIYANAPSDFGYYVYSPDEFGHSIRYAMDYVQNTNTHKSTLCKKTPVMYLVYYPTPSFAKTDPVYWKKNRVRIDKQPIFTKKIHDITIEKYSLTPEEISIQADPNIVCDLHFR